MRQFFIGLSICFLASGCFVFFFLSQGFKANYSNSASKGLWKVNHFQKDLQKGSYMEMCPPDAPIVREFVNRRILKPGACPGGSISFVKQLAAVPGDVVQVTEEGISVNGNLLQNSQGKKNLPMVPKGKYLVPEGYVWFVSTSNPVSFDSRYFGAVPIINIVGSAEFVFTF